MGRKPFPVKYAQLRGKPRESYLAVSKPNPEGEHIVQRVLGGSRGMALKLTAEEIARVLAVIPGGGEALAATQLSVVQDVGTVPQKLAGLRKAADSANEFGRIIEEKERRIRELEAEVEELASSRPAAAVGPHDPDPDADAREPRHLDELRELLEAAWSLLSAAHGGDWDHPSVPEVWREGAGQWRDRWRASLGEPVVTPDPAEVRELELEAPPPPPKRKKATKKKARSKME